MPCPRIVTKVSRRGLRFAGPIGRRGTTKRAVNAYLVVISLEGFELAMKIERIPEKRAVQEFAANRSDRALDEGM